MGIKDSVKMHVDEFKAKKKILKEDGKTDYKTLFIGLGQMVAGYLFFVSYPPWLWLSITFKVVAVVLFFNGVGFVLKSRDIDIKVEEHSKKKAKEIWGKD